MSPALLTVTVALALLAAPAPARAQTCTTPDSMAGTCIVIRSCPPLYKLLQGPKPLPRDVVQFLQKSTCGFEGHNPKVCCPGLDPIQTQGGAPPTQRPRPTPPPTQSPWNNRPATSRPTNRPQAQPVDDRNDRPVNVEKEPNLRLLPHSVCGPSSSDRIINGNKTNVYDFPWMARLGYTNSEVVDTRMSTQQHHGEGVIDPRSGSGNGIVAYRCGGSLINSRYVLTAAHCVEGGKSTESLTTVRLGENDVSTEIDCSIIAGTQVCAPAVVDVDVEEVTSHPDFSLQGVNRLQNDVALVRLARRVQFTEAVKPICLPIGMEQFKDLDRKKVTVAGWGVTEYGQGSTSLLQVNVPVVPGQQCVDVYKSEVRISPNKQLCAGGTRAGDSCQGDSGGPLKYAGIGHQTGDLRTVQFGIVSFGPKRCGSEGMPGVYTRVGYYMQWILRNMRP